MNALAEIPAASGPVRAIVFDCAEITGLTVEQLLGASRVSSIALPRSACMWAAKQALGLSFPRIATAFGRGCHTTILSAVRRADRLREVDDWFKDLSEQLVDRALARRRSWLARSGTATNDAMRLGDMMLLSAVQGFAASVMASREPNEIIGRGGPYIERWYLARKADVPEYGGPKVEALAIPIPMIASEVENIYLHRYVRADREHQHDHPWANASLILSGWLVEEVGDRRLLRGPGDIIMRDASAAHAIVDVQPGTTTLFVTMRKSREWGFIGSDGWVHWRNYQPMFQDQVPA